jgi:hypothetical protein
MGDHMPFNMLQMSRWEVLSLHVVTFPYESLTYTPSFAVLIRNYLHEISVYNAFDVAPKEVVSCGKISLVGEPRYVPAMR